MLITSYRKKDLKKTKICCIVIVSYCISHKAIHLTNTLYKIPASIGIWLLTGVLKMQTR